MAKGRQSGSIDRTMDSMVDRLQIGVSIHETNIAPKLQRFEWLRHCLYILGELLPTATWMA